MTSKLEKIKTHQKQLKQNLKRKRGGQPGNKNAYKHGFYSRRFRALELSDLSIVLTDNLDDEIALVRVIMRRLFSIANKEAKTLDDWKSVLFAIGSASTRLARLIRTQYLISNNKGGVFDTVLFERIEVVGHQRGFF